MIAEQLIKKAIKGNDEAFLIIMNEYKVDLFKTALAFLKNEGDALEAIQEVTFRAYKNIRKLRNAQYIKTWLFRIMINYCNDQLKIKKLHVFAEDEIENIAFSEYYDELEIKDAMLKLDERSRELLTLKYFNDMKIKEIAEAMQCPEGSIKTWLHKALKQLRVILDEEGADSRV
ncbi:sigma-70 family RNA polymerase sigma factor [Bacillus niameyensis]|uniref:sigma-70 family RNA polymerase sigma factor n=1 Tax=Bacillus niameyensis TaxID=1522308 RepID=UPI0007849206|nr:sigma-70 family RNA polymerase sigma factor [Bacillus niameyensis]